MSNLKGKTLFISGGSRGIGLAIAINAAKDGANVAIAAKTAEPHAKLKGTIFTAAEQIEAAGGKALPIQCDIRDEAQVQAAVAKTAETFGGIDICINNASAISLTPTEKTEMKRFDLMLDINTRGTFLVSKTCLPYLKKAKNPHILTLSPPLDLSPKWFAPNVAYTISKYGMSMCVLGMAEEFKKHGIGVNALWPRTTIATAAIDMVGGDWLRRSSRKEDIVADAAYIILTSPAKTTTGNFFIDDTLLAQHGVTDFEQYRVDPSMDLMGDYFVPESSIPPAPLTTQQKQGFVRKLIRHLPIKL